MSLKGARVAFSPLWQKAPRGIVVTSAGNPADRSTNDGLAACRGDIRHPSLLHSYRLHH